MTSLVHQALDQEIKDRVTKAAHYRKQIQTAKTEYKKHYFHKKLKQNNIALADILQAYDNLQKSKIIKDLKEDND